MNRDEIKKLEAQKEVSLRKLIEVLLSCTNDIQLSDTEKAQHAFDVLQRLNAACIAEVAVSLDNTSQISDEVAQKMKSLALMIFDEKKKLADSTNKNSADTSSNSTASLSRPKSSQQLSSVMNNSRRSSFSRT
ncbi:hypothetical protein [uncultured Shewanella sp.]|uniref:hypothetical protein n=1 Tax=uncultured Shewanella sp. TaxID=173975 RepID=UPI0026348AF1|nr:hypothetical protein [uncultured Shewanella sp.]